MRTPSTVAEGVRRVRELAWNRNKILATAADGRHQPQYMAERQAVAAYDVAVPHPPLLHRKDEPQRGIAHVDQVHDEVEIHLELTAAQKMLKHRGWRSEVVIMRADRHRGTPNDDMHSRAGSPQRALVCEHLRARIRTGHVIDRQ